MPQGPQAGRKRIRMDPEEMTEHTEVVPNIKEHNPTKTWTDQLSNKAIMKCCNITRSIYKKQTALNRLDEHVSNNTCPPSLTVNVRVMVSEEHQDYMNNKLKEAAETFQTTILKELVTIRKQEMEILNTQLHAVKTEWQDEFKATMNELQMEDLLQENAHLFFNRHLDLFTTELKERIREVRTNVVLQQRKADEKREQDRKNKADKDMKDTLEPDGMQQVLQKLNKLEKEIKLVAKKDNGKPPKKLNGGAKKPPVAKKHTAKAGNGNKKQPPNPKGPTQGRGKGRNDKEAKPKGSTNPSGSRNKPSRKKH